MNCDRCENRVNHRHQPAIRVYFRGDTEVHRHSDYDGADRADVDADGTLYISQGERNVAVYHRSHWVKAEKV